MRKAVYAIYISMGLLSGSCSLVFADNAVQTPPFSQNWSNTSLISVNDDWSSVSGITGYRGDGLTTKAGVDPQTILNDPATLVVDVNANQSNPATYSTGGVTEFTYGDVSVVALSGSGTADAPYLLMNLNTAGYQNINVQYTLLDIDSSADNSIQPVALQYRVGASGDFTNVAAAYVSDASDGPGLTKATTVNVTLPVAANNQNQIQLRVITSDAVGSDEWIGIDDIAIAGTIINENDPMLSIADVSMAEGNSGLKTARFTVSLNKTSSSAVSFVASTLDGTASAIYGDYQERKNVALTIPAGSLSTDFYVSVYGDTTVEADEYFYVQINSAVNATIGDNQAVGTILNDDQAAAYEIYQIQGSGLKSPYENQTVTTNNNVVTLVDDAGFYIQTPASRDDGDVTTSNGLYVYLGSASTVTVSVGDLVNVTGYVKEYESNVYYEDYFYQTEISYPTSVQVVSSGHALPAAIGFDDLKPATDPSRPTCITTNNFECFENMLVNVPSGMASSASTGYPTYGFYATSTGVRPMRVENAYSGSSGVVFAGYGLAYDIATAYSDLTGLPIWDGNPEVFIVEDDAEETVSGDRFQTTGVFTERSGYRLIPTTFTYTQKTQLPKVVDTANKLQLTIASLNMYRFFDNVNDAPTPVQYGSCTAETLDDGGTDSDYPVRVEKFRKYIREVLKSPMVIGLQEIENQNALNGLIAALNADGGPAYAGQVGSGSDVGFINVGVLTRPDAIQNAVVTQQGADICLSTDNGMLFDHPPLLLEADFKNWRGKLVPIAVQVNHTKSLISTDFNPDSTSDERNRQKRFEQAIALGNIVQDYQTQHSDTIFVSVGDFNAYEKTDGYVDVIGQITGDASQSENLLWQQPVANPKLTDATSLITNAADRYSYSHEGSLQVLDHAILNSVAKKHFGKMIYARGNAEAPSNLVDDESTPLRSSDHDGFVIYLNVLR